MIPKYDADMIRQTAVRYHIPIVTTIAAAKAAVHGLLDVKRNKGLTVRPIQEYHREVCV